MESGNLDRDVSGLRGLENSGELYSIVHQECNVYFRDGSLNDGGSLFAREGDVGRSSDQ